MKDLQGILNAFLFVHIDCFVVQKDFGNNPIYGYDHYKENKQTFRYFDILKSYKKYENCELLKNKKKNLR